MIFHENRLLADDSHEISRQQTILMKYPAGDFFLKISKNVAKFVVRFSREWRF